MLVTSLGYMTLLDLQEELNTKLKNAYEREAEKGADHLADFLISFVEKLIYELNQQGWSFGRYEYSGSKIFQQ